MVYTDCEACKQCGEYGFVGSHICPPLWKVSIDGYNHTGTSHAINAGAAAEKVVEDLERDEADYAVLGGYPVTVTVTAENGDISKYTVSGINVPQYTATEIREHPHG